MNGNQDHELTSADAAELAQLGVSIPNQNSTGARSSWAPERVLQAACAGQLLLDPQPGLFDAPIDVYLDGRHADAAEARALVDLTTTGLLAWIGNRVTCTSDGRDQLARWAKYKPMTCTGTTRKDRAA